MSGQIATSHTESIRHRVYTVLEGGRGGGFWGGTVEAGLVFLIVTNVAAYVLQSVPEFARGHTRDFELFEFVSVGLFTIEYLLRLWSAPEDPLVDEKRPFGGRANYALRPLMLIDFFAIAPAYVQLFVPFLDLRILRLVRLLRLLKIARYSPALSTLGHVIVSERRALFGTLLLLLCSVVFAGAAMHAAEGAVQPKLFGNIPNAMWWAISTLTTVGYGDAVPVTLVGRLVAGATMIVGLGLFALPVGIIATGFVQEIHRRDFVITFTMLSRVPLFRDFDARALNEIMELLRAQSVAPGGIISVKGEPATAMYFVVSGEVQVHVHDRKYRVGAGDFFGERALLDESVRHATIVAVKPCRLLVLSAEDFNALTERYPKLLERIEAHAKEHAGETPRQEQTA
mgnify:CR=1 FL=1